jgi:hypothetical protein
MIELYPLSVPIAAQKSLSLSQLIAVTFWAISSVGKALLRAKVTGLSPALFA